MGSSHRHLSLMTAASSSNPQPRLRRLASKRRLFCESSDEFTALSQIIHEVVLSVLGCLSSCKKRGNPDWDLSSVSTGAGEPEDVVRLRILSVILLFCLCPIARAGEPEDVVRLRILSVILLFCLC